MLRRADAAGRPALSDYLDASLLIPLFAQELGSTTARRWLETAAGGELVSSKWCETEAASGFARKVRLGELNSAEGHRAIDAVRRMLADATRMVPIEPRHFDSATDLIRRSQKPLRGGDALHLAIAHAAGATLWTLDRRMADAGQALGLDARLLA